MRKFNFFSAVLSLFLLVPASITRAQTISSQKGLTTAVFSVASGTIKVYLPDDIRPGDVISGCIKIEPAGRNDRQIEKNLSDLKKNSVSISSKKIAIDNTNNPFQFIVPANGPLKGQLELFDATGSKAGELTLPPVNQEEQQPALRECRIPSHALTGSPLRITGPFDGNSSNTHCSLNGNDMEILAESKTQCIVSYPADGGGTKTLVVQESGKSPCSNTVSGVDMNVSAGKMNLLKGEKTYIDISITGLQHLPDTAILSLVNLSAGIVALLPADNIIIPLSPGETGPGTFEKRFDIQSLKSGGFTVNVNLELPDVQADHPPTQPEDGLKRPGEHTQPPDSTQVPPRQGDSTIAQCPGCKCSCSASIIFVGKDTSDLLSYRVEVKSSCTGSFGVPPCIACGIIDAVTNEWTISYSADKPITIIGGNKGVFLKFRNPDNGEFSLFVKVTVTCSDGSTCTCAAETAGHPPTVPVETPANCKCNALCSIKKTGTNCDIATFISDVKAECTPIGPKINCAVAAITYLWYIGDAGKGVAGISGNANGAGVQVKIKKAGSYTLYLKVSVTCTDGKTCMSVCNITETDSTCVIKPDWCASTPIKVKALGYYPNGTLLNNMRPGELIGLTVFAEDNDVLMQQSVCGGVTGIAPVLTVPDEVIYSWEFAAQGGAGKLLKTDGNSNLYQLPYCYEKYPVWDEVVVRINNRGGKANDEEVVVVFTILLNVDVNGYNDELSIGQDYAVPLRTIVASITRYIVNKPAEIVCPKKTGCCDPVLQVTWEKGEDLKLFGLAPLREYVVDNFPDNMVILTASGTDADDLIIKCYDKVSGQLIESKKESVPDAIDYTWKVKSGNAKLIYNKGPSVVLVHTYGTSNIVYVSCEISDMSKAQNGGIKKKQFHDPTPEFYSAMVPARQKSMAVVALGDIEYPGIPLRHDELDEIVNRAVSKFNQAGYQAEGYYRTSEPLVGSFFKNARMQAVMLMGHAGDGEIVLTDKKKLGYPDVLNKVYFKWQCGYIKKALHPTIREFAMLGCESYDEKWPDDFFRLERYHAYRDLIWSTSFTSRIVDYIKNFKPSAPRIAPPE